MSVTDKLRRLKNGEGYSGLPKDMFLHKKQIKKITISLL